MIKTEEILKFFNGADFPRLSFLVLLAMLVLLNVIRLLIKIKRKNSNGQTTEKIAFFSKLSSSFNKLFLSKKGFFLTNLILIISLLVSTAGVTLASPKVLFPEGPAFGIMEVTDTKPLLVQFDRPIVKGKIEAEITPTLPGEWEYQSSRYFGLSDSFQFRPTTTPKHGTRYTVSLKGIRNIFEKEEKNYLFSFNTAAAPKVTSVTPGDKSEGILPNQEFSIKFDTEHEKTAKIEFSTTPEVALEATKVGGKEYKLKAKDGFKKSTNYELNVNLTETSYNFITKKTEDLGEKKEIWKGSFRTLEAPGVKDFGPKGSGILINSKIWVEFRQDMDEKITESAFAISPKINGSVAWEGKRKLTFSPSGDLSKNTSYTASISTAAKVADGSFFEDNFSFTFTTIGYVAVSSFYPGNRASGVNLASPISVTFNQAVDHASAQSKFSISPNVSGSFSWSGNKMTFQHSSFSYGTRYTVSVAAGVKTIHGLDSIKGASASFTTRSQSVMLGVPAYHQAHMYSCMASAARSALAYRGVSVSEDYLLSLIGYDRTPFSGTWRDPNAIWGNPYSGTVGNVDGRSGGVNWGYGAYWSPTASAISRYRPTEIKNGWNVQGLAREISNGNPVLIWWVNGVWPAYEVYWKTPSGQSIRGVNSMHVQVVKGFTGTVDNPTSFTVVDSGYGYPARTFDVGTFRAKWNWFGNTGVIVR